MLSAKEDNFRHCHLSFCLQDIQWTCVDSHFAVFRLCNFTFNLAFEHHAWHCCGRLNSLALPSTAMVVSYLLI